MSVPSLGLAEIGIMGQSLNLEDCNAFRRLASIFLSLVSVLGRGGSIRRGKRENRKEKIKG